MNAVPNPHAAFETCLVGTLETWPLNELLLWLHKTQRTAMVRVGSGLEAGVLFFKEGFLFRCEYGSLDGEQALMSLLTLTRGAFSLIQRDVPTPRPNIYSPTEQILLQCAVATDERRRAAALA